MNNNGDWPAFRRIHHELTRDAALVRHLRKCFFHELKPEERNGYQFAGESRHRGNMSVLPRVLTRIFWQVVRNADSYLKYEGKLQHWARFWTTRNLTTELRRAIHDLGEPPEIIVLPDRPSREQRQAFEQRRRFEGGKRAEQPEELFDLKQKLLRFCESQQERELISDWFDHTREEPSKEQEVADRHEASVEELKALLIRLLERRMLSYCESQQERELFADWWNNARENPSKEKEVAGRHGANVEQLNELLRRLIRRFKDDDNEPLGA